MKKMSIIIPIYNTGKYLHKCIQSVLNQTMFDFELILVNDGSTDNSGEILDEYKKNDQRIKVIHKKNEGVSIARNTGIRESSGEYIGFIDSDDWVEHDMFDRLYGIACKYKANIVMCDARTIYDDRAAEPDTIGQLEAEALLAKEDLVPDLLLEMAGSACRCIYKRELLENHNISFPVNLKFSEDRIFNILAFGYCEKVYYIKKPYYNRYMREDSAVNKHYDHMIDIVMDARQRIMDAINVAWNREASYKEAYEKQTYAMTLSAINNVFYKTSNMKFGDKLSQVRSICNEPYVRNAIETIDAKDIRANLIMNRQYIVLSVIAVLLNKKHGR